MTDFLVSAFLLSRLGGGTGSPLGNEMVPRVARATVFQRHPRGGRDVPWTSQTPLTPPGCPWAVPLTRPRDSPAGSSRRARPAHRHLRYFTWALNVDKVGDLKLCTLFMILTGERKKTNSELRLYSEAKCRRSFYVITSMNIKR